MIKKFFKYSFLVFLFLPFFTVFAKYGVWGLDNIDIKTRSEWGADESWKYSTQQGYQDLLEKKEEYQKYLKNLKKHNFQKYQNIKERQYREQQRNEYLKENYFSEIKIDEVKKTENGNNLMWNKSYKYSKSKILIHHTANDLTEFKNPEEVESFLRNIYRSHALSNGWGDLGYNFVIGPFGNIYEGRDGGRGVVGAHTKRNNPKSIGVALIGNFNNQNPTKQQKKALINLSVSLSKEYNIDPFAKTIYHKKSWTSPFINDVTDYVIAGHKDAGHTSCPGDSLHNMLNNIRSKVKKKLSTNLVSSKNIPKEKKQINLGKRKFVNGKNYSFELNNIKENIVKCYSKTNTLSISKCSKNNGVTDIKVSYEKFMASGEKDIVVETSSYKYIISFDLIWKEDINYVLKKRKENYKQDYSFNGASYDINKIKEKVFPTEAKKYLENRVKVLLYNLSQNYNSWDINCESYCDVVIDGISFNNIKKIDVSTNGSQLSINLDGNYHNGNYIDIYNRGEKIIFENYDRESYAGIPWNVFRGDIFIKKDKIDVLNGGEKNKYVIINSLPFEDYMNGIAETNDQIPIEKIKAMSLLIRNYVLFYFNKDNKHPSIPKSASYNAVDDPRIFQKYVGAGFEDTANKWFDALDKTRGEVVTYDNYIPILPYFNCSAGFTWSAKEKYGWQDTPWLSSKIDFAKCDDFNGHGVGLSGEGSKVLAERGLNYKKILNYYFDGIGIKNISK